MKSNELRLGISARMNTVMPRFHDLFGRAAPFGKLDASDIRTILADESWFSDSEPRWNKAPTAKKMEAKWRKSVKRLNRKQFHSLFPGALLAAGHIGTCTPNNRCRSNGCYLCARAMQRWLIWAIRLLHRKDAKGYEDIAFTYIFSAGQAPLKSLNNVSFDAIAARCSHALERTDSVRHAVLAYDFSLNVDTAKFVAGLYKEPPAIYWQVHIYGIARTNNPDRLYDSLRNLYPPDEKIDKPVLRKKFNGSKYGISYLLKPEAYRRIPYWSTRGKKPDWKTSGRSLKATEHVEYLIAAHDLGFARRVALINLHPVRLPRKSNKTPRIGLRVTAPRRIAESYDGNPGHYQ